MRRLALILAVFLAAQTHAQGESSAKDDYPKLETVPIRPAKTESVCASENCDPTYRLSDEQLDRLRALDRQSPGEIIQFSPETRSPGPRARERGY